MAGQGRSCCSRGWTSVPQGVEDGQLLAFGAPCMKQRSSRIVSGIEMVSSSVRQPATGAPPAYPKTNAPLQQAAMSMMLSAQRQHKTTWSKNTATKAHYQLGGLVVQMQPHSALVYRHILYRQPLHDSKFCESG